MNGLLYPYTSPIIMTDSIYAAYGGLLGTTTENQRKAAYLAAEEKVSDDIDTFLLNTTVTGTQYFRPSDPYLLLECGYVNRVNVIRFIDIEEKIYYTITGTANVYASLRDPLRGILDIHKIWGSCNCHSSSHAFPYQIQVVYEAGLPTGVASNHSNILMALTEYSKIFLNEVVGYGNESPGDIGVQEYDNQEYSEKRYKLKSTNFGSSAKAQFILSLLEQWRKIRFVRW